jgi:uncharacterized protein (TIGR03067 family)
MAMATAIAAIFTALLTVGNANPLVGDWKVKSFEFAGEQIPPPVAAKMVCAVTPKHIVIAFGDSAQVATYRLDESATPTTIDIVSDRGTTFGIYELRGDRLVLCYGLPGDPRPTEFASKAGTRLQLVTLERDRP